MPADSNPYASPADVGRDDPVEPTGDAVLLRSGRLWRRVWLPEPVAVVLEFRARTLCYDEVRVARRVVAWKWRWLWFAPRHDFRVMTGGGTLPGVLTVEVGFLLKIKRLTIEIDDHKVYEERAAP